MTPAKLYNYQQFGLNTLRKLTETFVYYSDFQQFNDPLDCSPQLFVDSDIPIIEKLFLHMKESSVKDPKRAQKSLQDIRYMATEFGGTNYNTALSRELKAQIIKLLQDIMSEWGVLCLAKSWKCPLMWSHYADHHNGICFEYDTSAHLCTSLKRIDYNRPRVITTTQLFAWQCEGSNDARALIMDTFFFTKAREWRYEKEWRDIVRITGPSHRPDSRVVRSPLTLSGIVFGLRCDFAIRTAIVKLTSGFDERPKFWQMAIDSKGKLFRYRLDISEIESEGCAASQVEIRKWFTNPAQGDQLAAPEIASCN